jgi:hypothetical protein
MIRNKLREVVSASKTFDAKLKAASGDVVLDDVPPAIWAKFSNVIDVDTEKPMFFQAFRWLTAELVHKDLSETYCSLLEALNLDYNGRKQNCSYWRHFNLN